MYDEQVYLQAADVSQPRTIRKSGCHVRREGFHGFSYESTI
jgi:hypothetical protein